MSKKAATTRKTTKSKTVKKRTSATKSRTKSATLKAKPTGSTIVKCQSTASLSQEIRDMLKSAKYIIIEVSE